MESEKHLQIHRKRTAADKFVARCGTRLEAGWKEDTEKEIGNSTMPDELLLQTLNRIESKIDIQNGRLDDVEKKIVEHETRQQVEREYAKKAIVKWGLILAVFGPIIASLITIILTKLV